MMDQATQQRIIREILHLIDTKSTASTQELGTAAVQDYIDPAHLAREQAALYRRSPLALGLSCQLASPGDFLTDDSTGVPILMVRGEDGRVRAFLNVCRHRGSRVCAEGSGNRRYFPCPYHAWTYDQAGALITCQDEAAFAGLDKNEYGLVRLPAEERHGLIWVLPTPGAALDVARYLGETVDTEVGGFSVAGWTIYRQQTWTHPFNWKLAVETFFETFHLRWLHRETVGRLTYSNLAAFEPFGLHHRLVAVSKRFEQLRAQPPEQWSLLPYATVVYLLFPNTIYIWQIDHVEIWQLFPSRNRPDECVTRATLLIPEPATTDSARGHWDRNWDVLYKTVIEEDFVVAATIQQGLASGAQGQFTYGRNEPALHYWQASLRQALAEPAANGSEALVPVAAARTR